MCRKLHCVKVLIGELASYAHREEERMKQRIKEHFVDCSKKDGFCFSLTCTVCGTVWKSSIVKPEVSTAAKRMYQNEHNRAKEAAYLEAATAFKICRLCEAPVCNDCMVVMGEMEICSNCAKRLQSKL